MKRQRLTTITIPIYSDESDLLNWIKDSHLDQANFIKSELYKAMKPTPSPLTAVELSNILDQKLSNLSIQSNKPGNLSNVDQQKLNQFENKLAGLWGN